MKFNDLSEILQYSGKIEQESYRFYSTAARRIEDAETAALALDLAEEETKHFNNINDLLGKKMLTPKELAERIDLDSSIPDKLVETDSIDYSETGPTMILRIAREREEHTRDLYTMFMSFTNLNDDALTLFEKLRDQEIGHARRITALLKKRATYPGRS